MNQRHQPVDLGILPGTPQGALFAAAPEWGLQAVMEPLTPADLHAAEAAWQSRPKPRVGLWEGGAVLAAAGVADNRDNQTIMKGDRYPNVNLGKQGDTIVCDLGVHMRMFL